MFDLTLFPLHLTAGRELADLPGFLSTTQPRRPERHRAGEQLVALLTTPNGQFLPEKFTAEMMQILSSKYFSTGGTVTKALRTAVDQLNSDLLKKFSLGTENKPAGLVLNLAVIHHNMVYIAHAGPTHTFVLGRTNVDDF